MLEKTREQIWADWVARQRGGSFPEMLNAQQEDSKYQIRTQLLAREFAQWKSMPRS